MAHFHARVPLAPYTTLELGGPAAFLVEVTSQPEVLEALAFAREQDLPLIPLGGGSNLVVPDAGVEAVMAAVRLRGRRTTPSADGLLVELEAGEPWDEVVAWTVANDWQGLECLSGIPGLVGATPVQNVGAYGQEVADCLESVDALDTATGAVRTLTREECGFSYRDSALKRAGHRFLVLRVRFLLRPGGTVALRYGELSRALEGAAPTLALVRETVLRLRRAKSMVLDPADPNHRSVGSFFTNPIVDAATAAAAQARVPLKMPSWPQPDGRVKLAAGWLIEQSGLAKGLRHGHVGLSSAHALALVHHGQGSTSELLAFADFVVARVREQFGVTLEREAVLLRT